MKNEIPVAMAVLTLSLPCVPEALAQDAYGSSSQEYAIPAQAFMPTTPGVTLGYASDSYLVVSPSIATGKFSAPIHLEAGARITRIECDFHAHVVDEGHVQLLRRLQGPGNVTPVEEEITHIHSPTGLNVYSQIGGNVAHTFQTRVGNQHAYYVIDVEMVNDGTDQLRFLGCRLIWNRQVSPAPATATFTDVPTSHPLHRFVEALAAAGITGGCTGSLFCPDAPLTRGQMAVFLSVALGLHFPF